MSKNVVAKIEELIKVKIEDKQFEFVDVEYVKEGKEWYLRIFIDKESGVSLDDCEIVSRKIGQILDETDIVKNSYILEVSSPGIERPLRREKDFERFIGSTVLVKTFEPIEGQKTLKGMLENFQNDTATITSGGKKYILTLDKIASANLSVEF